MIRQGVDPSAAPSLAPTRVRYWVIVFAVTLAVIQYIDRVCISQAAPLISGDLALSPRQMGYVFSAFTWAYALFEIPGGYLGDRIGPRNVLMRIVVWWSFFTAATGWAWSWVSLVVTRFLFGAGEAGCFPNLTKACTAGCRPNERDARAGAHVAERPLGRRLHAARRLFCLQYVHWRTAFLLFGVLGVVWAVPSSSGIATTRGASGRERRRGRATPGERPPSTRATFESPGGWLRSRTVWCLCGQDVA